MTSQAPKKDCKIPHTLKRYNMARNTNALNIKR